MLGVDIEPATNCFPYMRRSCAGSTAVRKGDVERPPGRSARKDSVVAGGSYYGMGGFIFAFSRFAIGVGHVDALLLFVWDGYFHRLHARGMNHAMFYPVEARRSSWAEDKQSVAKNVL